MSKHERNDWQLLLWLVFPFKVGLPFMVGLYFYGSFWNFLVNGEYKIEKLTANFSLLFLLHCYNQVAKIFTFTSDYSAYYKFAFPYTERKSFLWKLWNQGNKNQPFASQKEILSWNILLHQVSQLFNFVLGWFELSCSQETQCSKTFNNKQVSTMPCRISRLLCFTSTPKLSTWNTNWVRSEQYWCGGHSGRFWRSKFKRRVGILQRLFDK